ncbi:hypothetical protein Q9L58_005855 [Maublancomyces gigas]|uniref:Uncharacterized protein n=1 Tax=Discina gigas TaxID=1032678 RepID=A0ABR3GGY3_9PEZI
MNSLDPVWDGAWCWAVSLIECNVGIMTASMPGVVVFVRWVRGNTLEHGKPRLEEEGECDTVGHRALPIHRGSGSCSTGSQSGEEYEMDEMVRSCQVPRETAVAG